MLHSTILSTWTPVASAEEVHRMLTADVMQEIRRKAIGLAVYFATVNATYFFQKDFPFETSIISLCSRSRPEEAYLKDFRPHAPHAVGSSADTWAGPDKFSEITCSWT